MAALQCIRFYLCAWSLIVEKDLPNKKNKKIKNESNEMKERHS
jgi:hypothetical protein